MVCAGVVLPNFMRGGGVDAGFQYFGPPVQILRIIFPYSKFLKSKHIRLGQQMWTLCFLVFLRAPAVTMLAVLVAVLVTHVVAHVVAPLAVLLDLLAQVV